MVEISLQITEGEYEKTYIGDVIGNDYDNWHHGISGYRDP